ncbi:MAG: T9SS type A sorting domain-containing protein [Bacteroidia bacterium]|nr:T9SS type A sorting domain-containing protein [Bacteroidia bacterium]
MFVYPNPANDFITIMNPDKEEATMEILNTLGQVVYKTHLNVAFFNGRDAETGKKINISGFSKGIYFVKVKNENNFFVQKFIKQ